MPFLLLFLAACFWEVAFDNFVHAQAPKKLALLVGIDQYRQSHKIPELAGCVNDVEDMKALLLNKFEFPPENILVLTGALATRAAILKAFQEHLIRKAEPEAVIVFHFSGYGSQMRDVSGDEIDGLDETIVPYDSRDPGGKVFDLSDDELHQLFSQLSRNSRNVVFILDASHTDAAMRGAGRSRSLALDTRKPPASIRTGTRFAGDDLYPEQSNYVMVAACRAGENAYEHWAQKDKANGALTYFFAQELRRAGAAATYSEVMDNVIGEVGANYPNQHPQLIGEARSSHVFGAPGSIAQAYFLAAPEEQNNVALFAGEKQGLTAGSIFEIYRPGARSFAAPEQPLAQIELEQVLPERARGKIISGNQIPREARAVERAHRYPDFKLRLHYYGLASSATLREAKNVLDQRRNIEAVSGAQGYDVLLRQIQNEIAMEGGDTTEIAPRIRSDERQAVPRIVQQVEQWARWFNLVAFANPAPVLKLEWGLLARSASGRSRSPYQKPGTGAVFYEGEEFECMITNNSGQNLYFALLNLPGDGGITVLAPEQGSVSSALPPGAKWSNSFRAVLPAGKEMTKEFLKVVAITQSVDFSFLYKDPATGSTLNSLPPVLQLLDQAVRGTPRNELEPVPLTDWTTIQRVIEIRR